MAKTKKRNILKEYEVLKSELVKEFLLKHEYDLEYTSFEFMGHIVILNDDIYLSMSDIEYDIEKNIANNYFFDWYYYDLYRQMDGYPHVNYKSYIMGYRHKSRGFVKKVLYNTKKYLESRFQIVKFLVSHSFGRNKKYREEFKKLMEHHHNNPLDRCI